MMIDNTEYARLIVPALLAYAADRRDLNPDTALRAAMLAARIASEHMRDPIHDVEEDD